MNTLLNLLALAGGTAAAWHLVRAALRFLRGGAFGIWADELARTHARHGDLTSLDERHRERSAATTSARRAALQAFGWLAILVAPAMTSWPRPLYAAYTLLWVGPAARRLRRGRESGS